MSMENFDWHVENTDNDATTKTNNKSFTNLKKRRFCWNMKANFKTLFLASAALLMGLTACNNGEVVDNIDTAGTKTVKVSLSFDAPKTYAVGSSQSGGNITLNDAVLFFAMGTDGTGTITDIRTSDGTGKYEVSARATQVYVVANPLGGANASIAEEGLFASIASSSTLADVKDTILKVEDQKGTTTEGVTTNAVNMYGGGNLAAGNTMAVTLKTNVARIEIGNIKAKDGGAIGKSFKVTGIFIDGFAKQSTVDGRTTAENWVYSEGGTVSNFFVEKNTYYPLGYKTVVYDAEDTPLAATTTGIANAGAISDKDQVWGYNLFVPSETETKSFPGIVIRLSGLTVDNTPLPEGDVRYITIKSVKTAIEGQTVTGLAAGNVYTFENIEFDASNLGDPYKNTVEAKVTITQAQWTPVKVEAEL